MGLTLIPNTDVPAARREKTPDYYIMHGQLQVGRICQRQAAINPACQWIWAITGVREGPDGMHCSGVTATIEEAQTAVEDHWGQWMAWANLSDAGETIEPLAAASER